MTDTAGLIARLEHCADKVDRDLAQTLMREAAAALAAQEAATIELKSALDESIKLQSHYAVLLNGWDGGQRLQFANAEEWLARLRALAKKPLTPPPL
jgi:hypothetical protein